MKAAAKLIKVSQIKYDSKTGKEFRVKIFELNPILNNRIPNFLAYKEEKVKILFLPKKFNSYWAKPKYIGCWNNLERCIHYLEKQKGYEFKPEGNDK
jgi:hypothetical protein